MLAVAGIDGHVRPRAVLASPWSERSRTSVCLDPRQRRYPLDEAIVVRHTCDNPPCCNPAHLILGQQKDNIQDMHERGRASGGRTSRPGQSNPMCKLTDEQVSQIKSRRSAGEAGRALALEFGVSPAQISRIVTGKRWNPNATSKDGSPQAATTRT